MTVEPTIEQHTPENDQHRDWASVALVLGALGILAAVWAYWLVVPGIVLGVAAIVLGLRARRRGAQEPGSVAVALGIVSILLVPAVLIVAEDAENWGRDCAMNPANPDC